MSWPKLENGTVDWKSVFSDPETGLIAMVNRADTPQKLQACYHITINGLFSRKSDQETRGKYLYELDKFFSVEQDDRHVTGLQKQIRKLLEKIMSDRIERARIFAWNKEAGDERRLPEDRPLDALQELDGDALEGLVAE